MTPRHRIALASAPLLALLLAACSSASATPSSPNPGKSSNGRGGGGVVGLVAAVNGTVVQVQSAGNGQVAVDLTSATKITSRSVGTKSDVAVGDCVTATGEPDTAGDGLTARNLAVSPSPGGSCADGRRGGGNGNGGQSGSPRASRSPRPGKSGNPQGGNDRQAMISGTVSAVSGNTITVTGAIRLPGAQGGADTAAKTLSFTLDSTTKIQKEATATEDAIKAGICLAATGASKDAGAVQAKTVTIFPATGGACTAGNGNGGQRNGDGG